MSTLAHLFPIKILPEDIDFMGHVNNSRYLNWVQEAVLEHWRKLAPPDGLRLEEIGHIADLVARFAPESAAKA